MHSLFYCNLLESESIPSCALQVLHVGRTLPVTVTLQKIIEKSFPEEYAQRKAEALAVEEHNRADGPETPLPLFVMSCMMPGEFSPSEPGPRV